VLLAVAEKDSRTQTSEQKPIAFVDKLDNSSVNLVLRVWVDRGVYWDVLRDLLRDVKLALDEAGITIPFPQCDVHIKNNP
jgi:small conductance mechanosensitive channel